MSKSETKKDMWGNEYTQHYDDSGNKTGWSENKKDCWGNSYEQNYDQSGDKTGWTQSKSDAWGNDYSQHYDSSGEKSGWSESRSGAWGADYDQHYDNESSKTGWSETREDLWGNRYEQGYDQDGSKSGSRLHHGTRTRSHDSAGAGRSGYSSSYSGGSYEGSTGGDSWGIGSWIGGGLAFIFLLSLIPGIGGRGQGGSASPPSYGSPAPSYSPTPLNPDRMLTQQEVGNPVALASRIPSGNMTWGEYAITHRFTPYDRPRTFYAPGQPNIGWNVPMHVGPTTITAELAELPYGASVVSLGLVRGPDGRDWEVISRDDGTVGFVLQSELRGSLPSSQEDSRPVNSESPTERSSEPVIGHSEAAEVSNLPPMVSEVPDPIEVHRGPYDGKPEASIRGHNT